MPWLLFSSLMFVFSNLLYLLIRKAQIEKVKMSIYSISMFLVPAFIYFFLALTSQVSLFPTLPQFLLIAIVAFLWSYLGNFFSQRGILYAPNPGYSLILQKSYAILTTIAAFFLLSSEISQSKIVGIFIIVGFSALISFSKEKKKSENKWVLFSLGAHLCFAFGSLMSKYFLNIGLNPYTYLFYITLIVSALNLIESKATRLSFSLSSFQWLIVLGIGVANSFFGLFMQYGYKYAPNPGYVAAINTSSIMSLSLLSAVLFNDSLSAKKLIGVAGVFLGLLFIIF